MNKTETKVYEAAKKFCLPLQQYLESGDYTVMYDGEGQFHSMEFNDEEGIIALHDISGNIYAVYDTWDCEGMTITDVKQDLRSRIQVVKEFDWWK